MDNSGSQDAENLAKSYFDDLLNSKSMIQPFDNKSQIRSLALFGKGILFMVMSACAHLLPVKISLSSVLELQ